MEIVAVKSTVLGTLIQKVQSGEFYKRRMVSSNLRTGGLIIVLIMIDTTRCFSLVIKNADTIFVR